MGVSNTCSNALMDYLFDGGNEPGWIDTGGEIWCALCDTLPAITDTDITAKETDYTGYARVQLSNGSTFGPAVAGLSTNVQAITFPIATGAATSNVSYWAICDAGTTGNLLWWGDITTPAGVAIDDIPILSIGSVTIQLA